MRKLANTVGVGRHTEAEVEAMLDKDLRYFSAILGTHLESFEHFFLNSK